MEQKPFNHLHISARQWFDKQNGNTYFSAYALADGNEICRIPFAYGYGDQYQDEIFAAIANLGKAPGREPRRANGTQETAAEYCRRLGIIFTTECTQVGRKKDL